MNDKILVTLAATICAFSAGGASLAQELRKGGSVFAKVESDGDVRMGGSIVGRFERDGDIRVKGSIVGKIERDGDIRKGGSKIGTAKGVKKEHAAAIFFFGFFD